MKLVRENNLSGTQIQAFNLTNYSVFQSALAAGVGLAFDIPAGCLLFEIYCPKPFELKVGANAYKYCPAGLYTYAIEYSDVDVGCFVKCAEISTVYITFCE